MMYSLLSGIDMVIHLIRQIKRACLLILLGTGSRMYTLHTARCDRTGDSGYDQTDYDTQSDADARSGFRSIRSKYLHGIHYNEAHEYEHP